MLSPDIEIICTASNLYIAERLCNEVTNFLMLPQKSSLSQFPGKHQYTCMLHLFNEDKHTLSNKPSKELIEQISC